MSGSIFTFTRPVVLPDGRPAMVMVSIFADDEQGAQAMLREELASLRKGMAGDEPAFRESTEWTIKEDPLDGPKVISFAIT